MSGLWMAVLDAPSVIDRRMVVHAGVRNRWDSKRQTADARCGKQRCRFVVGPVVDGEGESLGHVVLSWPPRLSKLTDGASRCKDCYELTGKPRPSSHWDGVEGFVRVTAGAA